jgi:type I restriction enzyme S subunit
MNTKLLKQKILDLAIRGKLTQQLKSDGTAADLLKEIAGAKSSLSQPKGKKLKDSGQIIPFDKNEAPFEIPANWEWVRLGDVAYIASGSTPSKDCFVESGVPYLKMYNLRNQQIDFEYKPQYIKREIHEGKLARSKAKPGDVIMNIVGPPLGKVALVPESLPECNFNQAAVLIRAHFCTNLMNQYIRYFLLQMDEINAINTKGTAGQENISLTQTQNMRFPLPPLAEQQRIVEKIQEAFAEIDSIENNKELLKTHIKQARQKILDLAIHGKLVSQNKTDEPASVLLERITRDNPHYEKLTDIPFEIPTSWEWTRLGDVCKPIKRGKSPKYIEQSNVLVFAQKCNQKDGPVSLEKALYLDESTLNKYPEEEFLQKGDVVINSTGTGTLGRVGYFNVDLPQNIKGIVPDSHVTTIRSVYVNPYYLYCFLKNKQTYLEENGEGSTNQKELKPHTIYDLEFPLPPLAEQKRIVDKIEEIFALLDEISLHLV